MVGVDAFSQALTNPLMAHRVYQEKTFSGLGMRIIEQTKTLNDLVLRRPIFRNTAAYGHFGRSDRDFTWERTDGAADLGAAAKALA